jgi:hypothetical protein
VTHHKVIQMTVHIFPDRTDKSASLEVEVCGLGLLMRDRDILCRQEFGEERFRVL